jgi:hypothetical protein
MADTRKRNVRVTKSSKMPESKKRKETEKLIPEEVIAAALRATKGLQYLAAQKINMCSTHLSERIKASEYLKEVKAEALGLRLDVSEYGLAELTEQKDLGAICFMLKTLGKDRGYSETQQMAVDPQAQAGMLALMAQFADAQAQFSARKMVDNSKSAE